MQFQFNAQQHDPQYGVGGGALPAGKNKVVISATEIKPTKDGQNGYLALTLTGIEGPGNGISMVDRLNVYHANPQTVGIANQQLSAYCHVTGKLNFNDTDELKNIPFIVEVGPQKNTPEYMEVKRLFDINGNEPGKSGAGPQVNAQPQPFQQAPQVGQTWSPQSQTQTAPAAAPPWAQPGPTQAAPAQQAPWQPQQPAPQSQGWQPSQAAPTGPAWGPR